MSHIPQTGGPRRPSKTPWNSPPEPAPPRRRPGVRLKSFAIWALLIVVLSLGYSFRREIAGAGDRIAANLTGGASGYEVGQGLAFERARDGHFYVRARVNGTPIVFLVDTGASAVVLSPKDAARLGFEKDTLNFRGFAQTANGRVAVAPVLLDEVDARGIAAQDVPALVNGTDLEHSLLGMTYLNRIGGFEVRDERLVLFPKEDGSG